ncbi:bck1-like resistance to osmotic shock [Rhizophlyctis rosea]|uniref:BRO domain-containing protein 1 n=1 Tax=Rhizophlyctis rosea TaxID=64517 RepID=A0AAD5XA90_9FUNG|nr:bck1-like resistance to osmotic shock [Rhizophlyctis rosea]
MTSTTHLAPLLHVPTKKTDEVDFAPSFRAYIQSTYQDDPDKYANEIATLNRLRQDTRGAGKDVTGRDILYRYYGQLELLDLRFPVEEKAVKVLFTWYDAFSQKPISQYSIAYEKACTIFNIAATCSSIAALQNRFEPAGLKTAYNYFQAAAGLFAYINDNFLHAPSVDLSRDSIKTLVELMLAQAQECMIEKMVQEKKKGALVAKLAAQTAHMYGNVLDGLTNDAVSSQFQKAWVDLVKIKAKHFQAVSYYHKSFALEADGKSGENVAHLTHAEALAKEANSLATAFTKSHSSFTTAVQTPASSSSSSSGQPTAAGAALLEAAKADLSLITERKNVATKDNDLIYHEAVPNVDTLPAIEKLNTVKPITFAEICTNGQADIPKIIGADIFQRLIPLSVHESSSLYSEEKAKVLRAEQGRVEAANGELQAMMESMNLIPTIDKLKRQIKGGGGFGDGSRLPDEVMRWQEEVYREERGGSGNSTDEMVAALEGLKQRVRGELDETGLMLDREQHECEGMRVKYMDQWTQEPSATLNSHIRQDIRQNRESFEKALSTDQALFARINESKRDVSSLKRPIEEVESIFAEQTISVGPRKEQQVNLIDADTTGSGGLGQLGEQVLLEKLDGILMRLRALKKERLETLEDLKSKLHADDISSLLLLNKNKETQIFQSELSKFKPLQSRLSANIQQHQQLLQDLTNEFGKLRESSQAMKSLDLTEKRKADLLKQWRRSYDLWREARDGLKRGMQFYSDLSELVTSLRSTAATFADRRSEERNQLAKKIEAEQAERGQQALREQLHRLSVSGGGTPSAHGSPAGTPVSATPGYAPAPYAGPVPNPPVPQSAPVPAARLHMDNQFNRSLLLRHLL